MGLGDDAPSPCPRCCAGRRLVIRRSALGCLPQRVPRVGESPVTVIPPLVPRRVGQAKEGKLAFFGSLSKLAGPDAFATYLAPLRKINWVVYAKQPFGGPEAVLAYLSRYTHRIAISNHRLMSADADVVTFKWKDYRIKSGDRMKVMRLNTSEFIRRFLIHILPSGFHRIRHTGFLANGIRRNRIEMIRRLLDLNPNADLKTDDNHCADANEKEQACPKCGGVMIVVETFKRGQLPRSRAPPWEDAA